jgi:hypothetical protein
LGRHVLQVAGGVQRLALHSARHAQLAPDVHARERVVAAVEAALDLVLAGGEEALDEAGLLHLRVERREVRGDRVSSDAKYAAIAALEDTSRPTVQW